MTECFISYKENQYCYNNKCDVVKLAPNLITFAFWFKDTIELFKYLIVLTFLLNVSKGLHRLIFQKYKKQTWELRKSSNNTAYMISTKCDIFVHSNKMF